MNRWIKRAIIGLIIIAALLVLPRVVPPFYVNLLVLTAIYGLVTTGLVLLTGYAGLASLGHAAFFGFGAYGAAILAGTYGLNPWLSLLAGTGVAAVSAYLSGLPLLRLSGHYLALATLAWCIIANTLFTELAFLTGGANGFTNIPVLSLFGYRIVTAHEFYYLVVTVAALGAIMLGVMLNSRAGRAIRALRSSEVATAALGVNVSRFKLQIFILSAAFAGLGGGLYAYFIAFIGPTAFDVHGSIRLLAMAMIGGAHPLGGIVGAGIITMLDSFLQDMMPNSTGQFQVIFYGAVLVLLMLASPKGLAPVLHWLWRPGTGAKPDADTPGPKVEDKGPARLEVREASRSFGGLLAVNKLSLEVQSGEIVGLIGPNGAGKTTAFNLLTGVLPLTAGTVVLDGQNVTGFPAQRMATLGLTRTFQNTALFDMSVLENVMMGAYPHIRGNLWNGLFGLGHPDRAAAKAQALRLLERVGLDNPDAAADTLAVGQRRLLEVARALALHPRVLLLDEPAAGLRSAEKQDLADVLRGLRAENMAILLVEHDMDLVMNLADRIVVMNYGKMLAAGEPGDIANNPEVIEAYLGSDAA